MRVFIAGATGFVGSSILDKFNKENIELKILTRNHKEKPVPESYNVEYIVGDILNPKGWEKKLNNCDAVINLVGIIKEFPSRGITFNALHVQAAKNITDAALNNGIKRYIHMSANGVNENATTGYFKTKYEAECIVKKSGLDYTIIRPSLIFGEKDSMTTMLASKMSMFPIFLCFGKGDFKLQPIYVEDVANVYYNALVSNDLGGKILHIGGPEVYTWLDFLKEISIAANLNERFIKIPEFIIKAVARIFGRFNFFPMTYDQLIMLLGGNVTPDNDALKYSGAALRDIKTIMPKYLNLSVKKVAARAKN